MLDAWLIISYFQPAENNFAWYDKDDMQAYKKHVTNVGNKLFQYEKARFLFVGIINTVVDFGVLLTLSLLLSFPVVIANIISTSCALTVSYVLNKRAVFGDDQPHTMKQILLFLIVTLSGLWVLQNIVILGAIWLHHFFFGQQGIAFGLVVGKLIATTVTMLWNYLMYSNVVFHRGNNARASK